MLIALHEDDRRTPSTAVTADVLTLRQRGGPPQRYRMSAAERHQLTQLRDAAFAELGAVEDPQTLVESREHWPGGVGRLNRLVVESRGVTREIEWTSPDRVPAAVEALHRGLEGLAWTVPRRQFDRTVTRLCRDAIAARTGTPAAEWTVVSDSREMFDHHRSLPDADDSGFITGEGVNGHRVTLRRGDQLVAFHAIDATEVLFAEEWRRGEFPRYVPALLDIAHNLRSAGRLERALGALERIVQAPTGDGRSQAGLEIAEVLAQGGRFDAAEARFRTFIGAGSQEEHALAVCGIAWVDELRSLPAGAVSPPPPSRWLEMDLHPWWRPGGDLVAGVPAQYPLLQSALDSGRSSHRQAWEARNRDRGLGA